MVLATGLILVGLSAFKTRDGIFLEIFKKTLNFIIRSRNWTRLYFTAYNDCDMETQEEFYDDDLEFYHDKGGLATSKVALLESIEKNICGKVTRALLKDSVEVHDIPGFGAVEIGIHKFYNKEEPDAVSKPTKFISIWKQEGETWNLSRVISLH